VREKVYYCNVCGQVSKTKKCQACGNECVVIEIPDHLETL